MSSSYKNAGVDIEAGNEAVRLINKHVKRTFDGHVLGGIGSFGGLYDLNGEDVLVAGCDGVGTKLMAAFIMDRHDTVGIDCVAMCVNDVVCLGAKPIFFLDYIATGKLNARVVESIVKGIAEGCVRSGCALIGGETAEMPGFYKLSEYDVAGFCVGIVKKSNIIDGSAVSAGDKLIGLASSGVHSNGFSFVRSIINMEAATLNAKPYQLNATIGDELMEPTRIYVKTVLGLISEFNIKGIAHITGGGFMENIPRMMGRGLGARINLGSWEMPQILEYLMAESGIGLDEAYTIFNMGIGMVLAVSASDANAVVKRACELGDRAYVIGEVINGEGVTLCG